LQRQRGQVADSLADAQTAVEISRDMDNQLWEGTALLYLGKAQRATGQAGEALVSYQRAAVIFLQEGDLSREAMAIEGTGRAYSDLGRVADAVDFHRHAAAVHRQVGDRWKLATSLGHLAHALSSPEDQDEATRLRAEALAILDDYPDSKSTAYRSWLEREGDASA
jgi:tetratricopeptide (TPR) repeat protein